MIKRIARSHRNIFVLKKKGAKHDGEVFFATYKCTDRLGVICECYFELNLILKNRHFKMNFFLL